MLGFGWSGSTIRGLCGQFIVAEDLNRQLKWAPLYLKSVGPTDEDSLMCHTCHRQEKAQH